MFFEHPAAEEHPPHRQRVRNVVQGVALEQHDIRQFAWLQAAQEFVRTHHRGAVLGRDAQHFERRDSRLREILELGMDRLAVLIPGIQGVRTGKELHAISIGALYHIDHGGPDRRSFGDTPKYGRQGRRPTRPGRREKLQDIVVVHVDGKHVFRALVAEEDSPDRFLPGPPVGSDGQPLLDRRARYRVMERPRQGEIGLQADSAWRPLLPDIPWSRQ